MGIFVFTEKESSLKDFFPKTAKFSSIKTLAEHTPGKDDISYIDILTFTEGDIKKIAGQVKKSCGNTSWGIIDPKGNIKDPAALFFEGACDYLGPGVLKTSGTLEPKRIKEAGQWQKKLVITEESNLPSTSANVTSFLNSSIKLPASNLFPGWKKMQTGKTMPFYLMYCSLEGKIPLDERLDDKIIAQIHLRFLDCLEDNFHEGDGLLWMNSGKDCLFLIPPKAKCAEAVVKACINMIVSSPVIVLESFGLKFPANFIFALHYGLVNYKPPGKTGTVVSEAVNYIFHLGTKKAEPGRLTISGSLPDKTIPQSLYDSFVSAGKFQDHNVWHTKKFSYSKPWF
jgi:hypothetical protein